MLPPREVFVIAPRDPESVPVVEIVRRAVEESGLVTATVDSIPAGEAALTTSVLRRIRRADLIVAVLSHSNPNVLYELGFAHALRKPTILLFNLKSDSGMPTDLTGSEFIGYYPSNLSGLSESVKSGIKSRALRREQLVVA